MAPTSTTFVHAVRGIHAQHDGTDWQDVIQDGLGSVRGLIDDRLEVDGTQSYDPYGVPDGSYGAGFGYAGEQIDSNGLSYNRARYYDPGNGLFTALDPLETPNRYAYVAGNPVNLVDPTGLQNELSPHLDDGGGFGSALLLLGLGALGTSSLATSSELRDLAVGVLDQMFRGISNIFDVSNLSSAPTALFSPASVQSGSGLQPIGGTWATEGITYNTNPAVWEQVNAGAIAVPQGAVASPPMPGQNPLDDFRRACNNGLCPYLLWELLRRLTRNLDKSEDQTRRHNDSNDYLIAILGPGRNTAEVTSIMLHRPNARCVAVEDSPQAAQLLDIDLDAAGIGCNIVSFATGLGGDTGKVDEVFTIRPNTTMTRRQIPDFVMTNLKIGGSFYAAVLINDDPRTLRARIKPMFPGLIERDISDADLVVGNNLVQIPFPHVPLEDIVDSRFAADAKEMHGIRV